LGWKTTQLGGGCKSTNYFCPQCMVLRKTISHYNTTIHQCALCVEVGNERCFCHPIVDSSEMQQVEDKLQEYVDAAFDDGMLRLNSIWSKSKMNFNEGIADKHIIKNHIGFQPKSKQDALAFSKQLVHEIKIRMTEAKNKSRQAKLINSYDNGGKDKHIEGHVC
jgi:hypothetical protein